MILKLENWISTWIDHFLPLKCRKQAPATTARPAERSMSFQVPVLVFVSSVVVGVSVSTVSGVDFSRSTTATSLVSSSTFWVPTLLQPTLASPAVAAFYLTVTVSLRARVCFFSKMDVDCFNDFNTASNAAFTSYLVSGVFLFSRVVVVVLSVNYFWDPKWLHPT